MSATEAALPPESRESMRMQALLNLIIDSDGQLRELGRRLTSKPQVQRLTESQHSRHQLIRRIST